MKGLLTTAAGFIPGIRSFTALLNPTVIAAVSLTGLVAYGVGSYQGGQRYKAACVAATEKAKADAAALDRSALEEQIKQERQTNAELQADIDKSRQEIADYAAQHRDDNCRVTDGDIADGL